jgi:hypothetical protein
MKILPLDSFIIGLHTCSGLMSALCQLDGAHSEFLCGVANPLGVKVYRLPITKNSHHFIEPFFDLVKCSLGSM